MTEKRTFVVYNAEIFNETGELVPVMGKKGTPCKMTGRFAINVANKVAAMGITDIIIRQTTVKNKIRRYTGSIEEVTLQEKNMSPWMLERAKLDKAGNKVFVAKKGVAKYVGLVKLAKGTRLYPANIEDVDETEGDEE